MFVLFAELIVSCVAWIFGSNFDSFLIAHLFKKMGKQKHAQTSELDQNDPVLRRISKQEIPRFLLMTASNVEVILRKEQFLPQ